MGKGWDRMADGRKKKSSGSDRVDKTVVGRAGDGGLTREWREWVMKALPKRLEELERRVKELEERPRPGRPDARLQAACEWLGKRLGARGRKGERAQEIMRAALASPGAFNESLVRKAANRMGVNMVKGVWTLELDEE